jgi:hypothetical protein
MAFNKLRLICTCESRIPVDKSSEHVCYSNRNRDNDTIRPELIQRRELRHKQMSGQCTCKGRNKDCTYCGGTGRPQSN